MATSQDTSASAQLTLEDSLWRAVGMMDKAYAINDLVSSLHDVAGALDACEEGTVKVSLIHSNDLLKQASELVEQAVRGLRPLKQQEGADDE